MNQYTIIVNDAPYGTERSYNGLRTVMALQKIKSIIKKGSIGACGTCMDARGLSQASLIEGVYRSSMNELADWIISSEKVITF